MAVTPPRPLAEGDDRNLFDCGRESLNIWFRRHAWANQTSEASRVNIITDAASGRIVGYVALSAAQIERAFLPRPQQRNRPDPVPVTFLGQLAERQCFTFRLTRRTVPMTFCGNLGTGGGVHLRTARACST